ncbi:Uncharacterized protein APZ42_032619 [Daphnia magna]|uniref:Uncharacterized protein n=1 Tax=Daphnia magna TaxID=35525 RepID=A0A164LQU9_9CRUS|nr:Uncharacterized protein APZ42_032619 [Daphnia magna]
MTHTTNGFARKSFTIQSGSFCLFHQILELSRKSLTTFNFVKTLKSKQAKVFQILTNTKQ